MAFYRISFHVTDRCQLNCDHCLRDPGAKALDLPLSILESAVDQARDMYGVCHVGLTGGEPTLHPQFYEMIDAIVDRGCTWHMVTNGTRFDRVVLRLAERPERLARLRMLNLSLDGATEETHDGIREHGNFEAVMRAASICELRKIPFLFQITLNARNVHEIEAMALLASQLGAKKLAFNFTQPTGTFLDASMHLPASEWKRAMDRIQRVRGAFKIEVITSENGPTPAPFFMCEMWRHDQFHVDTKGRLSLCCQHSGTPGGDEEAGVAGDLRTTSLSDAHARFTDIVHEVMQARLRALREPDISEWDRDFSCNWCLKHFGKPHWDDAGTVGPAASRVRWRGKWQPGYKESHVRAGVPAEAAAPTPLAAPLAVHAAEAAEE
jgi:MoaA/NifB/PqqE/SkfB family radical SAM enzyme